MPGAARFHVWVCLRAKTVKWKQAGPPGSRPPLHKQTGTFRLRREEISYKFPAKTILRHSFPLTPRGQTQHVQLCRGFFFLKCVWIKTVSAIEGGKEHLCLQNRGSSAFDFLLQLEMDTKGFSWWTFTSSKHRDWLSKAKHSQTCELKLLWS